MCGQEFELIRTSKSAREKPWIPKARPITSLTLFRNKVATHTLRGHWRFAVRGSECWCWWPNTRSARRPQTAGPRWSSPCRSWWFWPGPAAGSHQTAPSARPAWDWKKEACVNYGVLGHKQTPCHVLPRKANILQWKLCSGEKFVQQAAEKHGILNARPAIALTSSSTDLAFRW